MTKRQLTYTTWALATGVFAFACDIADTDETAALDETDNFEESEEASDQKTLDQLGIPRPGPHPALDSCYWEYAETTSSSEIRTAPCIEYPDPQAPEARTAGSQTYPVSGGCHTDSNHSLKVSIPLEFNGSGIDDDESVTNGYRWLCRFSGAPSSGTAHRAWALCCIP